jgi:hypothetical protein
MSHESCIQQLRLDNCDSSVASVVHIVAFRRIQGLWWQAVDTSGSATAC